MGEAIKLGGGGMLTVKNGIKMKLPVLDDEIKANTFVNLGVAAPEFTDVGTYTYEAGESIYSGAYNVNGGVQIEENKYLIYGGQTRQSSTAVGFVQVVEYDEEKQEAIFGPPVDVALNSMAQSNGQKAVKVNDLNGKKRVLYVVGSGSSSTKTVAVILTIDGLNVTVGESFYVYNSNAATYINYLKYLDNGKALLIYYKSGPLYAVLLDVSTDTIQRASAELMLTKPTDGTSASYMYFASGDIDLKTGTVFVASNEAYNTAFRVWVNVLKIDGDIITEIASGPTGTGHNGNTGIIVATLRTPREFGILFMQGSGTTTKSLSACAVKLEEDNTFSTNYANLGVALTNSNAYDITTSKEALLNMRPGVAMLMGHIVNFQHLSFQYIGHIPLDNRRIVTLKETGQLFLTKSIAFETRHHMQHAYISNQIYGLVNGQESPAFGITATSAKKGNLANVFAI